MTTRLKGNMADIAKTVDELSGFTVMEVADLVKQLEAKWGVTAAAPVMAAPPVMSAQDWVLQDSASQRRR